MPGDLATRHALRGYDGIHLGSALHVEGDDILLAPRDDALNPAARATGQLIATLAMLTLGGLRLCALDPWVRC